MDAAGTDLPLAIDIVQTSAPSVWYYGTFPITATAAATPSTDAPTAMPAMPTTGAPTMMPVTKAPAPSAAMTPSVVAAALVSILGAYFF